MELKTYTFSKTWKNFSVGRLDLPEKVVHKPDLLKNILTGCKISNVML